MLRTRNVAGALGMVVAVGTACGDNTFNPFSPRGNWTVGDAGTGTIFPPFDGDAGARPFNGGPAVSNPEQVPPISGGTLLVLRDGVTAIAADPDRDRIVVVDLANKRVQQTIELRDGDQPGRSVEHGDGRVSTVLRGAREIVTYSPTSGDAPLRRTVCALPRGIAHQASTDQLHIACQSGELVTFPAGQGAPVRTLRLDRDLRDVVVEGDRLLVSRFRSAEILAIDENGAIYRRHTPAPRSSGSPDAGVDLFSANTAWRMLSHPNGVIVVHQVSKNGEIEPVPGGYGADPFCGGIVKPTLSIVSSEGIVPGPTLSGGVLAVDVAVSPDGERFAVAMAGSTQDPNTRSVPGVVVYHRSQLGERDNPCGSFPAEGENSEGEIIAVAFDANGWVVAQQRDPAVLIHQGARISLGGERRIDSGHAHFHTNAGAGVACASCHPEGGDDSHVWVFAGFGPRRTQSMLGGISGTEPLHWDGDMRDFNMLVSHVFTGRMSGPQLPQDHVDAMKNWIDRLPYPPSAVPSDARAAERGRSLFDTHCGTCHNGPRLNNTASFDVGTGGVFQVPSLRGIGYRAPYLHTGCAPDLTARFGGCGGGDAHGNTSRLTAQQIADLVHYLETL